MLGVGNSAELAILTLELPLHLPLAGLKGLLGLNPNKTKGRYNRKLRYHIAAFAANLYTRAKKHANVPSEIIEITDHLPKEIALYKLQLMTLKDTDSISQDGEAAGRRAVKAIKAGEDQAIFHHGRFL
jgi:hypothetical protein